MNTTNSKPTTTATTTLSATHLTGLQPDRSFLPLGGKRAQDSSLLHPLLSSISCSSLILSIMLLSGLSDLAGQSASLAYAFSEPMAPVEEAFVESGLPIKIYGFILPTFIQTSGAVESLSQPNSSAFTAAGNPVLTGSYEPSDSRLSFQVQQSRFGFNIGKDKIRGTFEFDFFNAQNPTPTAGSLLRLRRAFGQFFFSETDSVVAGQDWDVFAPLIPHTYNLIGHFYMSGDLGFMRQQLVWVHATPSFESRVGIGMQMPHNASTSGGLNADSLMEVSNTPTLAVRLTLKEGLSQLGISGIATRLLTNPKSFWTTPVPAYGATLFAEWVGTDVAVNIRSEFYIGRNLANLGTFSLGFFSPGSDMSEAGGWFTVKKPIGNHAIYGGVGYSAILNQADLKPSYLNTSKGPTLMNAAYGPGINWNGTARLGYAYEPVAHVSFFTELAYLQSSFALFASDIASGINSDPSVFVSYSGMMLTF